MKITVKDRNPELTFKDLRAGDIFCFIEDGVANKNAPYIKTDEQGDFVSLRDGVFLHYDVYDINLPVQKVKAEIIIE